VLKTILITGASSGFGLMTARLALSRGWNVVATAREAEKTLLGGENEKERVLAARLDVRDEDSIGEAVSLALGRFGAIDALVNNAGIGLVGAAEEISRAELTRQFETNFFGAAAVTLAVLPSMRERRRGEIVFVSSDLGRTGVPGLSSYCAAKHALEGWAESLSHEVRPFGIGVTLVEPGAFRTGFHDRSLARVRNARDVSGPYGPLYVALQDRFFSGPEPPTGEVVAEVILRAAEGAISRLRVPVGEDSEEWARRRFKADEEAFVREIGERLKEQE
jgi:NAD(P)-dependent dehydrogenase (short-subunit alcohol dehydrogenase family)